MVGNNRLDLVIKYICIKSFWRGLVRKYFVQFVIVIIGLLVMFNEFVKQEVDRVKELDIVVIFIGVGYVVVEEVKLLLGLLGKFYIVLFFSQLFFFIVEVVIEVCRGKRLNFGI